MREWFLRLEMLEFFCWEDYRERKVLIFYFRELLVLRSEGGISRSWEFTRKEKEEGDVGVYGFIV